MFKKLKGSLQSLAPSARRRGAQVGAGVAGLFGSALAFAGTPVEELGAAAVTAIEAVNAPVIDVQTAMIAIFLLFVAYHLLKRAFGR